MRLRLVHTISVYLNLRRATSNSGGIIHLLYTQQKWETHETVDNRHILFSLHLDTIIAANDTRFNRFCLLDL